jgi:hypothetical protein
MTGLYALLRLSFTFSVAFMHATNGMPVLMTCGI